MSVHHLPHVCIQMLYFSQEENSGWEYHPLLGVGSD